MDSILYFPGMNFGRFNDFDPSSNLNDFGRDLEDTFKDVLYDDFDDDLPASVTLNITVNGNIYINK